MTTPTSNRFFVFSVATLLIVASGCDTNSVDDGGNTIQSETAQNISADPATGRDPVTGQPTGTTGNYTLFSIRENTVISSGSAPSPSDSASTAWDIGFRGTSIIVNGGTSGPGSGGVILYDGIYEDLAQAPETGYQVDGAGGSAVSPGSGNGWYNYNPTTMVVSPIPGRFLVVRTANGHYAKVKIISYYRNAPANVDPFTDAERYYTFEFIYQADGSRNFE